MTGRHPSVLGLRWEHLFATVALMKAEERFVRLRQSAACVILSREQVSELIAITATLFEERTAGGETSCRAARQLR